MFHVEHSYDHIVLNRNSKLFRYLSDGTGKLIDR